jgi:hypothetical protein
MLLPGISRKARDARHFGCHSPRSNGTQLMEDQVKQYEYSLAFLDRLELRTGVGAFNELNRLGAEGWRVVHVRDDPQHHRDLVFFMEREKAS